MEVKLRVNVRKRKKRQNLNAAARDLGTLPTDQIMFDGPQLCLICGPRPILHHRPIIW
jgi:hypothetical protein